MTSDDRPTCFVISVIGDVGSPERIRADKVLKHVITPAALAAGFGEPDRADQLRELGMITEQIVERLVNADIVVADLTGRNPNVYYELATRHALKRPAALLYDPAERIPFDISDLRAIPVTTDVEDSSVARASLEVMLNRALEAPDEVSGTPFTRGLDLTATLEAARVSQDELLIRLVADMEQIRVSIDRLGGTVVGGSLVITTDETTDPMADRRRLRLVNQILADNPGSVPVEIEVILVDGSRQIIRAPSVSGESISAFTPHLQVALGVLGEVRLVPR